MASLVSSGNAPSVIRREGSERRCLDFSQGQVRSQQSRTEKSSEEKRSKIFFAVITWWPIGNNSIPSVCNPALLPTKSDVPLPAKGSRSLAPFLMLWNFIRYSIKEAEKPSLNLYQR